MRRFLLIIVLLVALSKANVAQNAADGIAWIRGANFSEDIASIDLLANGEVLFSEITFPEITSYVSVPADVTEISIQLNADETIPQFDPITVPLTAGETYFFAIGGLAEDDTLEFIALPESITVKNVARQNPTFDDFSFDTYAGWIFLHGVSEGTDLSVVLQTGELIIPNISFPGLYISPVSRGRFPILVLKSSSEDEIIFNDLNPFTFNQGVLYLTAAVGNPSSPQLIINQVGTKTLSELTESGEIISLMHELISQSAIADDFSDSSSYTLFLPTDNALENSGINIDALLENSDAVNEFIENHTISGNYTFDELRELEEITTLNDTVITIALAEDDANLVLNNTIPLNFLGAQGLNGIIYLIDGVIEE